MCRIAELVNLILIFWYISRKIDPYHGCWCPGSFLDQAHNSNDSNAIIFKGSKFQPVMSHSQWKSKNIFLLSVQHYKGFETQCCFTEYRANLYSCQPYISKNRIHNSYFIVIGYKKTLSLGYLIIWYQRIPNSSVSQIPVCIAVSGSDE